MAPEQVQRAAKCIVGVDYPKPMIDHEMAAKQNHERMRQVYQQLSTYRNIKTPEDPECDLVKGSEAGGTFVSSKYANTSLTLKQRKEQQQLMPAPMPVPQVAMGAD